MVAISVAAVTEPSAAPLAEIAAVFDQYRRHYRSAVVPGQTLAWLHDQIGPGRMTVFTARNGDGLAGLATTISLPASLRLGCFWQIRDLYVVPGARRQGIGRALIDAVRAAAEAAGAIRLSVQTEPDNAAALQLYGASGFAPVEDLLVLALPLRA
jgi:GNAT superfamily N-acetyltransferase